MGHPLHARRLAFNNQCGMTGMSACVPASHLRDTCLLKQDDFKAALDYYGIEWQAD